MEVTVSVKTKEKEPKEHEVKRTLDEVIRIAKHIGGEIVGGKGFENGSELVLEF